MAGNHGARQQKKMAKQKAKKSAKRTKLLMRDSPDPTIRLASAESWPVVQALLGDTLWSNGLGYATIARRDRQGQVVFAVLLVDVYCLGVKDAFWKSGSQHDFKEMVAKMEKSQEMEPVEPAALVKLVTGAIAFAQSCGFPPHPDYRHASRLLAGIDPSACSQEFTFGRDGKPFYVQGPFDSSLEATTILRRIEAAGGHFMVGGPDRMISDFTDLDDGNELESFGDDKDADLDPQQIEDSARLEPGEAFHSSLPAPVERDARPG